MLIANPQIQFQFRAPASVENSEKESIFFSNELFL